MKVFQYLAQLAARKSGNWEIEDELRAAMRCYMPKGEGFPNGTFFNGLSSSEELIFTINYFPPRTAPWTSYTVTVRPSFHNGGFSLKVSGLTRADEKPEVLDMLRGVFTTALEAEAN